jgi:peptidoglycan/xylan/chitin deacetylase (PgdA/CDA1 family)
VGLLRRGAGYEGAKGRLLEALSTSGLLGRLGSSRSPTMRVLAYHDVLPEPIDRTMPTLGLTASVDEFEWQMRYLKDHYQTLSLEESIACLRARGARDGRPPVIVTFDDGHRNNLDHALPILQRHGIPAVCFIVADYVDAPRSALWIEKLYLDVMATEHATLRLPSGRVLRLVDTADRANACGELFAELRRLPRERFALTVAELQDRSGGSLDLQPPGRYEFLSTQDLKHLMDADISIGSHSRTHALLSRLSDEAARDEIAGSKTRLEVTIGTTVSAFAFPFGEQGLDFGEREMRYAAEAGYELAFAGSGGPVGRKAHRYSIPRVGFEGGIDLAYFQYCLSGLREPVQTLLSKL